MEGIKEMMSKIDELIKKEDWNRMELEKKIEKIHEITGIQCFSCQDAEKLYCDLGLYCPIFKECGKATSKRIMEDM